MNINVLLVDNFYLIDKLNLYFYLFLSNITEIKKCTYVHDKKIEALDIYEKYTKIYIRF